MNPDYYVQWFYCRDFDGYIVTKEIFDAVKYYASRESDCEPYSFQMRIPIDRIISC